LKEEEKLKMLCEEARKNFELSFIQPAKAYGYLTKVRIPLL
jgi:hypothetical protein